MTDFPAIIIAAKLRMERGESFSSAAAWVWDMSESSNRLEVDDWLVANNHPLAFQPGTREQRFRCLLLETAGE